MKKRIKEEFKPVIGYEDLYQVTNTGKVYSIKRDMYLTPVTDKYGYYYVNLCKNGEYKSAKIHRLVAQAFLGRKLKPNEDVHHLVSKDDNCFQHMIILTHAEHIKLHKLGSHLSDETKDKLSKIHKAWWKEYKKQNFV